MPAKSGGRRSKHRRSGQLPTLATSLGPPSGFAASTDEDENGTLDEAVSESELREADDDLREAESQEAPSSTPRLSPEDVAQLHAQIELL